MNFDKSIQPPKKVQQTWGLLSPLKDDGSRAVNFHRSILEGVTEKDFVGFLILPCQPLCRTICS